MVRRDTADNRADLLTKPLARPAFEKHRDAMAVLSTLDFKLYYQQDKKLELKATGKVAAVVSAVSECPPRCCPRWTVCCSKGGRDGCCSPGR